MEFICFCPGRQSIGIEERRQNKKQGNGCCLHKGGDYIRIKRNSGDVKNIPNQTRRFCAFQSYCPIYLHFRVWLERGNG